MPRQHAEAESERSGRCWQTGRVNLGWLWTENLRPLLEILSSLVSYGFDDLDWTAIEAGIVGTDSETSVWFEYPLAAATVHIAHELGAEEMVSVRIDGVEGRPEIELLDDIMREYKVSPRTAR